MSVYKLNINNNIYEVDVDSDTPLLWVLRDHLNLVGTKFGCGKGVCGGCTIHLDGIANKSCLLPVVAIGDKKVTTIEGLSQKEYTAVQQAWKEVDAPQCGYCHSGQIMAASSFLEQNPQPSKEEIRTAMSGNICRCASYNSIEKAVEKAAKLIVNSKS